MVLLNTQNTSNLSVRSFLALAALLVLSTFAPLSVFAGEDGPGCTNSFACNYDPNATEDDGSCEFTSCLSFGCATPGACNYDPDVDYDDGSCEYTTCVGCMNTLACDFDPEALIAGLCNDFESCYGCMDEDADNYDSTATHAGDCEYDGCTFEGACNYDETANNDNGSCEYTSCAGCTNETACDYDPTAIINSGNCTYPDTGYDCDGNCTFDADGDGVCDMFEVFGCDDATANNYDSDATENDGSCTYTVEGCTDQTACNFNSNANSDDGSCEFTSCAGCLNPTACNYDETAIYPDTCEFPESGYNCDGSCVSDNDGDGVCDQFEIDGCTNSTACNYEEEATDDDGSCDFITCAGCTDPLACNYDNTATLDDNSCEFTSCLNYGCMDSGACNYDADAEANDGSCEYTTCAGCTNPQACDYDATATISTTCTDYTSCAGCMDADADNYDPTATISDSDDCIYYGCTTLTACNYSSTANTDDGSCEYTSCAGCLNESACNYDATAVLSGDCTFPDSGYDCDGACLQDTDADGICDPHEIEGCTDSQANNYDSTATDDDGSCAYTVEGCTDLTACNYNASANSDDSSCEFTSCAGCMNATACNYDENAIYPDDCVFAETNYDCDGNCLNDDDSDGVCNELEVDGCTDSSACNYDETATDDDGSCDYSSCEVLGCTNPFACNYNDNATADDNSCEFVSCLSFGCTNPAACNFDPEANYSDGSCEYTSCAGCMNPEACDFDADALVPAPCTDFTSCAGCMDEDADNYDPTATIESGDCIISGCTLSSACNYNPDANNNDGSCDFISCLPTGCMNALACNFDPTAVIAGDCEFPESGYDCDGNCLQDTDGDGICDPFEIDGCTNTEALNYDEEATDDDGSCILPIEGCTNSGACNFDSTANTDDGSCEYLSCVGCIAPAACNYDSSALIPGDCEYPDEGYDCDGDCIFDTDGDGVCDMFEVFGCTLENSLNFDEEATENDGSCILIVEGCTDEDACNFNSNANVDDSSCDYVSCVGCMDTTACDFDPTATQSGECTYASTGYYCDGSCTADFDGDGICDMFEIEGCMDDSACNYFEEATDPDDSCEYAQPEYNCDGTCISDQDEDEICDAFETAPDLVIPSDMTVECTVTDYGTATTSGGCSTPSLTFSDFTIPGNCPQSYVIMRTYLSSDNCGNLSTATQAITVVDSTSPTFTSVPADYSAECSDELTYDDATATDNCGEVTITVSESTTPGLCSGEYVITRIFTATDECGNSSTAAQNITLTDTTNPVFTSVPEDYTAECSDDYPLDDATATDNCGDVTITVESTTTPGSCAGDYILTRTFTATDDCGNTATAAQTITIVDTTAPVLSIPADYTAECSDEHPMDDATATDNCGTVSISVESVTTPGDCDGEYTITRTFTATDDCGNSSSDSQTITIVDTTAPTISNFPADLSLDCDDANPVIYPTATDLCSGASIELSESIVAGENDSYILSRTFTATDGCGNSSSQTQTITVADSSPPVFTYIPADYSAECSGNNPMDLPTATDNCGDVEITVVEETTAGNCTGDYTLTRTFTATDNAGNSISATQTIVFTDTTAPTLTIPADYTAECSDEHPMEAAVATDNCGSVQVSMVISTTPGDCAGDYTITRTFTAIDDCGNSTSAVQTITIIDTTNPVFTSVPADYTAECSDDHPMDDAIATDNCGEVTITVDAVTTPGACTGDYTITRTFTASDDCGNSTTATQVITIIDTTAPVLTVPSDYTAECSDSHPLDDATATDNCGNVTITLVSDTTAGSCAGDYVVTRTFTATDDCGHSTSATQTITIIDTTAPVLTIPADYTAECSDAHPMDDATATDNCGTVSISVVENTTNGDCAGDYVITRTFTATDDCGNSTTDTQTITIVDTTAPVFTSVPQDYTAECSDEHPMGSATASDNCGSVSITVDAVTTDGNCAGDYIITRTFTATDDCGNTSTATQVITIVDTTAPALSIPADYTAECSDTHPMDDATATDNCGEVTISVVENTTSGSCAGDYVITRTFTATDDCGNSTSSTQTITIIDTTAPVLSIPTDYTAECSDEHPMEDATATDNCGSVTITVNEITTPGACAGNYVITRTFTATDDCGNSTSDYQTIVIVDTTSPVLNIPADYTAECSDAHPMDDATATDNCGEVTINVQEATTPGSCAGDYVITRTFTATDDCGNSTTATQTITIIDTTAPVLNIPVDYTAECSDAHPMDDATATDNCGAVNITVVENTTSGSCAGDYVITRTFTATDDCGNATTATQTITIVDTTSPIFTSVPQDYMAECSDEHPMDSATASDNCGAVSITVDAVTTEGNCAGDYVITRTFTATDDCGNTTTATQVITIVDTTAPILNIPADYTAECSDSHPMDDATATDNCGEVLISVIENTTEGTCAGEYVITRTFTATDDCGNSTSATQTITIIDTTSPVLNIPEDYTAECSDAHPMDDATATDNCGAVSITVDETTIPGACAGNYVVSRTFTATDDCGNSTTATQTITIIDTTSPVLTIPADYTAECSDAHPMHDATATDNCGEVTITVEEVTTPGSCAHDYVITRTFTATDDCGNATTATQTITIIDTTAPVFTSVPQDYTAECSDEHPMHDAVATDNCGEVTINVQESTTPGSCAGDYVITRTFTASDECGNSTTASQVITIIDTTAPILTIPSDYSAECSDEHPMEDATATDNCSDVEITLVEETYASGCDGVYTIARTFTATDACGNTTSATQYISINDTTAPTLTVPADYTADCTEDLSEGNATAVDACSEVFVWHEDEITPGSCSGEYIITRTFTAVDGCGNGTTGTQIITVVDTTAPELAIPADYTIECSDELILSDATATDNCGEVSISVVENTLAGACSNEYTLTRTFTATDDCGNSISATQTITVVDTTAPTLSVPADFSADCNNSLVLEDATASDNCGDVSITVVESNTSGDCAGEYTLVRTFTATDDCGNSASGTQTITVTDNTAPEFTSVPADYTAECSDEQPMDEAIAIDSCGEVTITVDSQTTPGSCDGEYTITRTFTATDDCGNSSTATQTITIVDTTAPILNVPADFNAECNAEIEMEEATASDNCSSASISVSESIDNSPENGYLIIRQFTATDDCGNSSTGTQVITVMDSTPPVLSIPNDYAAECSISLPMEDATATDNCGSAVVTVEVVNTPGDCDGEYIISRIFTATDDAGNVSTATQTITVVDTTAPTLDIPSDYTTECSEELVLEDATATDYCSDPTITVETSNTPGSCAGEYTITRTFIATDACGNSTSETQTITVIDTTAPILSIPADYTAECSDVLVMDEATATDNCGEVSITVEENNTPGSCSGEYTITRTFTATDDCGNSTSSTQTISVVDTTAPEFTFVPADFTAECSDTLPTEEALAVDACGDVEITYSDSNDSGDCSGGATITRTYTATDECGNTATATQIITLIDTTAPVFTFVPADITAECSEGVDYEDAQATDDCGSINYTVTEETTPGSCPGNYVTVRTFTATDDCGNSATATQTITIVDTTGPEIYLPSDYSVDCELELYYEDATATDQCGTVTSIELTATDTVITSVEDGTYLINRTFTATDDCGNTSNATQIITVNGSVAEGDCDCDGNTLDAIGECGGDCEADLNEDGICDSDQTQGCTDPTACNYDEDAVVDDGNCNFPNPGYDCDGECLEDTDGDGVCDINEIYGCTDPDNPGYNPNATEEDGSCLVGGCIFDTACNYDPEADYQIPGACDFESCKGCTDPAACNYDPDATQEDYSCEFPDEGYDCNGICISDIDDDGICDVDEIPGCTDPTNPGYDPFATDEDGSCLVGGCSLPFACNYDPEADYVIVSMCEFTSCQGCTDVTACNYDPDASLDNGSCIYGELYYDCEGNCQNDSDGDGICDELEVYGCTDPSVPNYDPSATDDDGSCLIAGCILPFACNYNPLADYLDITLCDFSSCIGCMEETACNYDPNATLASNNLCDYPENEYVDCYGFCFNDSDGDGVCDELEVYGCTDPTAVNFDPMATEDDGTCSFDFVGGCNLTFACNYDPAADYYLPGSCDFSCLFGIAMGGPCMDPQACNYGSDLSCNYFDADGNICAIGGCTLEYACNYNEDAQYNDGSCVVGNCTVGCIYENALNFDENARIDDGSCEFEGCTDAEFDSYNPIANTDGECENKGLNADFNRDSKVDVEDLLSFLGVFNSDAPAEVCAVEGFSAEILLEGVEGGCAYEGALNFSADVMYDEGACVFAGCTDEAALNFNKLANVDDGTCVFQPCPDFNNDGKIRTDDLLKFLGVYGR